MPFNFFIIFSLSKAFLKTLFEASFANATLQVPLVKRLASAILLLVATPRFSASDTIHVSTSSDLLIRRTSSLREASLAADQNSSLLTAVTFFNSRVAYAAVQIPTSGEPRSGEDTIVLPTSGILHIYGWAYEPTNPFGETKLPLIIVTIPAVRPSDVSRRSSLTQRMTVPPQVS